MDGGGSVGNGGHHLAEGLGPHIADGVDAGNAGLCGFSGSDIARLIQLQMALKQAGGGLRPTLTKMPSQGRSVSSPVWTSFKRIPVSISLWCSSVTTLFQRNSTLGVL